jgi:predicted TIM-barrel fold metal-dependent hydrolase
MVELARSDNVMCKISGLGMRDPRWTVDGLRPWVVGAIEIFGTERCFFGTNWPVDRLYSSYPDLVRAYLELIDGFTVEEQSAMLVQNAERVYGI